MIVKVYSTSLCPYCHALKEYLKGKNIQFESYDIGEDEIAREEMIDKSGQMTVPVIIIDSKVLIGIDKIELDKALGI